MNIIQHIDHMVHYSARKAEANAKYNPKLQTSKSTTDIITIATLDVIALGLAVGAFAKVYAAIIAAVI